MNFLRRKDCLGGFGIFPRTKNNGILDLYVRDDKLDMTLDLINHLQFQ